MALGTEVGLGPGHIVLEGDPAPFTERGTAAATLWRMSKLVVHGSWLLRRVVNYRHTQIRFAVYGRRRGSVRP